MTDQVYQESAATVIEQLMERLQAAAVWCKQLETRVAKLESNLASLSMNNGKRLHMLDFAVREIQKQIEPEQKQEQPVDIVLEPETVQVGVSEVEEVSA